MVAASPQAAPPAACLLAYRLEEHEEALGRLADELGVPLRRAEPEESGQTVGYLTGWPGSARREADAGESEPCLVMSGLPEKTLDTLLLRLKGNGINIPLKAVVTPANRGWTLEQLTRELRREREAFRRR